jgi:glycosyltransferase involved in cell wall biosynthesis
VHVLTSPKEGWGITNIEAAACGTPTIASDSPGLRDSVEDGRTGFLVPHGDVAALTARMEQLLGNATLRNQLGEHALAFAQRFTWDRAADDTEQFLLGVVGNRSRAVGQGEVLDQG